MNFSRRALESPQHGAAARGLHPVLPAQSGPSLFAGDQFIPRPQSRLDSISGAASAAWKKLKPKED